MEEKTPLSYSQVNQRDEKAHCEIACEMYSMMMSEKRAKDTHARLINEYNKELEEFINDAVPASVVDGVL